MSKRLAWLLGVVGLVLIGLLVACGTTYNSSSDGLVLVGSQGSGLIETFSFNLSSGHASAVDNTPARHVESGVRSKRGAVVDCDRSRGSFCVRDYQGTSGV